METKEFPTRQINTDNSNKEFTGPLPPLDEIEINTDNSEINPSDKLGNETFYGTVDKINPVETDNITPEKSSNKKKIITAISGIALVAVGMATYVGNVFGFKKEIPAVNPPKSQVENTQSSHETVTNTSKPNTGNSTSSQNTESNAADKTSSSETESSINQSTYETSTVAESQTSTQETTISSEYIPATHSELMQYRPDYLNVLSSTESVNALFQEASPEVDKLGSWCFEQTIYGGYLDSMYDTKWEYKRVNADSPMEDIINNTNIELIAAHASNDEVDGKVSISKTKCYAITNYVFDSETGIETDERNNILNSIDESVKPTKLRNLEVPISSSEVFTCKRPNGETTRSIVIDIQMGDTLYKRVYSEKLVKDFKGEEYIHMKVSGLEYPNLTNEEALAAANLTVIK